MSEEARKKFKIHAVLDGLDLTFDTESGKYEEGACYYDGEAQMAWQAYQRAYDHQQNRIDELEHNYAEAKRICKEICWLLGHETDSPSFCDMQGEVDRLKRLFDYYCEPEKSGGTPPKALKENKE